MRFALLAAFVLASVSTGAQAQTLACDAFAKNADGSWAALRHVRVPGPGTTFNVNGGAVFRPTDSFMGMNLAQALDHDCTAQSRAPAEAATRVELPKLADAKGNIDIQELTCGQLAGGRRLSAHLVQWLVQRTGQGARAQHGARQRQRS
jgi:hypothetical protein